MLQTTLVWRSFFEDTNNNQGYIFYDCAAVTKYADILFSEYDLHKI